MIPKKLSTALGVTIILITIAFLLSSDSEVASAADPQAAIPSATFPGANVGAVADGTSPCWNPGVGAARDITFAATGLGAGPPNVEVSMTWGSPTHTFVGDITAVLIAPNGASHTLFGHTLATTATAFGDSSDLGTIYNFKDSAAAPPNGGWWQAATAAGTTTVMPTGDYRTTASGGAGAVNPQPPTNMNASFMGVANANGTWTLRVTDGCAGDTGSVTAASLTITTTPTGPTDANVDLDGNGRTDYVVARGTNTPLALNPDEARPGRLNYSSLDVRPTRGARSESASAIPEAPPIYWYTLFNNSGATAVQPWGDAATDFITPEDFDGDGKDDLTIWRPVPGGAQFWIFQSSTNTAVGHSFGIDGDDPAVVGDYDGDNKADVAVFRCPGALEPDGQCYFFYRGTNNNPGGQITYVPWGFGVDGDFFPYVGDFDGDQKNDFCLQRSNPSIPANGQFILLKSSNLTAEFIDWGFSSDFIIPGDYDGDGKSDFCVRRSNTPSPGVRTFYILTRTGATSAVVWSATGDASAPGDYDGDGKTDIAVWRGSATPGFTGFWVLNSSNGAASFTPWGQCATVATCDFAVAGWAVH
jgi:hypothetical protein